MDTPFFSIIIPTYNRATHLPKTLESIINQTFKNYEIILVDDGSTDNTKIVVENLKIKNLHYLLQQNAERSAARNNGMRMAKGIFFCFLDSDDFYYENHLQVMYNEIMKQSSQEAMYFVDCNVLKEGKVSCPPSIDIQTDLFTYFLLNSVIPARVCLHRNIAQKFRFDIYTNIGEDAIFWCHIATQYKAFHIKERTILYHLHEDNTVMLEKNCFLPRLQGLKRMFDTEPEIKKRTPRKSRFLVLSDCYFGIARHYELVHKFFPMCYNVFLSILFSPFNWGIKKKLYMIYAYLLGKPSNNY